MGLRWHSARSVDRGSGEMMNTHERIRMFIQETFLLGEDEPLDGSISLLDSGVMDSTGVLELIAFLERELGLEVADEDVVPENLDTIDSIASYVQRKRAGASDGALLTKPIDA